MTLPVQGVSQEPGRRILRNRQVDRHVHVARLTPEELTQLIAIHHGSC